MTEPHPAPPLPPPPPDLGFATRFLVEPALFPARIAGDAWGEEAVVLDRIPGGPYRVAGLSAAQRDAVLAAFGGRPLAPPPVAQDGSVRRLPAAPREEIRVYRIDRREFRRFDTRAWELTLDLDPLGAGPDGGLRLCSLGLAARIEGFRPLAAALWTPEDGAGFAGVLENVLRPAVAYRLLDRGGLLLHAAGVVLEEWDGAVVGVGVSGAGKSTLARLSLDEGRPVLSDDMMALEPAAGGATWIAHSIPFTGDLRRRPEDAPPGRALRAIVRLEKTAEAATSVEPLAAGEAAARLIACAPYVNCDPSRGAALQEAVMALLDSIPALRLRFRRDVSPWPALLTRHPQPPPARRLPDPAR